MGKAMGGRQTRVFEAVAAGDGRAVAALLSGYPALASSRDDDGIPLLHAAVGEDDAGMVDVILDHGADVTARSPWGQTALEWATTLDRRSAAEALLTRGLTLHLWTAAGLGKIDVVRSLLADGTGSGAVGRTPEPGADLGGWPEDTAFRRGDHLSDALYIACRNGDLPVVRELRRAGADVNATGYFGASALHWAAHRGHREVVEWLVRQGADSTARDPEFAATPAGWAREGGHTALADALEILSQQTETPQEEEA